MGIKNGKTEHGPPPTANRVLVWMFYLNNDSIRDRTL